MKSKKILISGASKGIGKAIAILLDNSGYNVIGTSRNPDEIEDKIEGVEYIKLDLLDESSIDNCIQKAGNIDILINNAGQSQIGAAEEISIKKIKDIFQINLFGIIKLTQGFLPGMIQNRNGFIINIGSLAGIFAVPFQSSYVASKSALSGFTWSLRNEVMKYGVKVVLLDPHDINTTIQPQVFSPENSRYKNEMSKMMAAREKSMANANPPEFVAKMVVKILKKKNPKPFYAVGGLAPLLIFLKRFLPDKTVEKLLRKNYDL
ncbi:MAG: SDR family oxidoreductase [bacterium]|nr:MAG: SDR family oxidoreductase [bacterium]